VGDDNVISEGTILGGIPQDLKFSHKRSYLTIGNRNTIRELVTISRATDSEGETRIGNDNYIMANVHIAHNCVLEDHIVIANNSGLAGYVSVGEHTRISGVVGIQQFTRVGKYAMIGAMSGVRQDVLPFFLTEGVPARVKALNVIGLRRGGYSDDAIRHLKEACRILFRRGLPLKEKLEMLSWVDSEDVSYLVRFIEESTRGFSGVEKWRGESREGYGE
jgi:UDP-N-acetylglucosamine acyltransferase